MNEKQHANARVDHANRLVDEYIDLEITIADLDEKDSRLRAEIDANAEKARELVERQERLADVLAPALRRTGAVYFQRWCGRRYAIGDGRDERLLTVIELAASHSLDLAPRFTEEEVRDAVNTVAFEEAVKTVARQNGVKNASDYLRRYFRDAAVNLPGRQAVIEDGVSVIDQEAG